MPDGLRMFYTVLYCVYTDLIIVYKVANVFYSVFTMRISLFHEKGVFHFEPSGLCLVRILLYRQKTCILVSQEELSSFVTRRHDPGPKPGLGSDPGPANMN